MAAASWSSVADAYHAQRGGISYDQRWNNTAALTTLTSGGVLYHHARSEYQESILKYGLLRSK